MSVVVSISVVFSKDKVAVSGEIVVVSIVLRVVDMEVDFFSVENIVLVFVVEVVVVSVVGEVVGVSRVVLDISVVDVLMVVVSGLAE